MEQKKVNVAILGFGTVGSGVYRVLTENHNDILHRDGIDFQVKRILVRDFEHEPNLHMAPRETFTTALADITGDASVSIVVECMGGVEPAKTFILSALNAGKSVVTSNKEVMSKHWPEFEAAAKASGAGLYLEATVGGGIPVLRTITDSLQANNITGVMGIINGTTNFILTKMSEEGRDFADVLKEAQQLGYAEANPEADVEGFDATYKLSILSSMAFHAHMPIESIHREGITKLTAEDFEVARQMGYEIKLLAIGKKRGNEIEVRVHPTMIPKTHPLAAVRGSFNAIFLSGNAVDDVMLYGRGAGQMPTASAVVGDMIYAVHNEGRHRYMTFANVPGMSTGVKLATDWESIYCVRVRAADQPGVLCAVSGVFAKHGVSLKNVLQFSDGSGAPEHVAAISFVTHKAHEQAVQAALEEIGKLDTVLEVESVIRVEE
ncbi:MAG: homoserine dehydrogenase [Eubacteriales bacterium]|nr:homoserine dehydrogenase [Eubacteriales bacterium]